MVEKTFDIDSLNFESLARDILSSGNTLRFRARGGSMRPLIRDGEILEVAPIKNGELHLGDIVLFSDPTRNLMAHRLIHRFHHDGHSMLVLQGDANFTEDRPVSERLVIGRIIAVIRDRSSFAFSGPIHRVVGWIMILFAPLMKRIYFKMVQWVRSFQQN
jgi:signal peptidase I